MIANVARSIEQHLTLRVCLRCVTVYYNNRLWSTSGRVEQGRMTLPSKARALAYHPTGTVIAVALMTGAVLIVQSDLKAGTSPLQTLTDSKEWCQCIKYVFVVVALYILLQLLLVLVPLLLLLHVSSAMHRHLFN
jgi:hypothetical protein